MYVSELSMLKKIIYYIELVNMEEKIPSHNDKRQFSDGSSIGNFWYNQYEKIYSISQKEDVRNLNPIAYTIIKEAYFKLAKLHKGRSKRINFMSFNEKCIEFFNVIEKNNKLPTTDNYLFSDGTMMKYFLNSNYQKIYDLIINEQYRNVYPKTYNIISIMYIKKQVYCNNAMIFDDKVNAFLMEVNESKRIPKQGDKVIFKDGTLMSNFWNSNIKRIYSKLCNEGIKSRYPCAYNIICERYKKIEQKLQNPMSFVEKCEIYFDIIEKEKSLPSRKDKRLFDDGTHINRFWNLNFEKIYDVMSKYNYRDKYPDAYTIIMKTYDILLKRRVKKINNVIDTWDRKKHMNNIINVCVDNNIDISVNKDVIEHISFKELVAKIAYLSSNNIVIVNNKGLMHPIFSMSNINIQANYDISLEEIIDNYFGVKKLKLV